MEFTYSDSTFSDLVKEVYGTRGPSREYGHLSHYYNETSENKQEIWDDLCDQLNDVIAEELEANQRKTARFEDRIQDNIKLGAGDRKTAIRWIFQADGISFDDPGYACYLLNIPYSYEDEFRKVFS
tara:strand:- start:865 stop:1242 length:378 start_codon:yes stop_codon:yes gene_type:complete